MEKPTRLQSGGEDLEDSFGGVSSILELWENLKDFPAENVCPEENELSDPEHPLVSSEDLMLAIENIHDIFDTLGFSGVEDLASACIKLFKDGEERRFQGYYEALLVSILTSQQYRLPSAHAIYAILISKDSEGNRLWETLRNTTYGAQILYVYCKLRFKASLDKKEE
jgi:hypothetical protein